MNDQSTRTTLSKATMLYAHESYLHKYARTYRRGSNGEVILAYIHISEVKRGDVVFFCACCNNRVVPARGKRRAHHFEHTPGCDADNTCPARQAGFDEEAFVAQYRLKQVG